MVIAFAAGTKLIGVVATTSLGVRAVTFTVARDNGAVRRPVAPTLATSVSLVVQDA